MLFFSLDLIAKNYPFDIDHDYDVQIVRVSQHGTKFLKVFGTANTVNKAMDRALQDAVAACLFTGVNGNEIAGKIPALCGTKKKYYEYQAYFDSFFKKGEFLSYVRNVNSGFPTGEDNVSTKNGRRVGIYVQVMYDDLRNKLVSDGIIQSLDNYF